MRSRKPSLVTQLFSWSLLIAAVIGLNSDENWMFRGAAGELLLFSGFMLLMSGLLSRRYTVVTARSKIAHQPKIRLTVEILGRLLWLGGLVFIAPILFNTCFDFVEIAKRGHPAEEKVKVVDQQTTGLFRWVWHHIDLQTANDKTSTYNLFFHPHFLRTGEQYDVVVLPRSKCVLSFAPVESEGN
jgi:hypothetical protein